MTDTPAAIVVTAIIEAKPGSADDVVSALSSAIEQTHAEDGCLSYALHRDTGNSDRFVLIERWRSQADMDAHGKAPYLGELFQALAGKVAGAPTLIFTTPVMVGDPAKGAL
jgi:quinol monooxygenase YgiN